MNGVKKVEERIDKREKRIEKLQSDLKEEKNKLKIDQELLVHLKYDEVLKTMHENGVSPDEALRAVQAIESDEVGEEQSHNSEGVKSHENRY